MGYRRWLILKIILYFCLYCVLLSWNRKVIFFAYEWLFISKKNLKNYRLEWSILNSIKWSPMYFIKWILYNLIKKICKNKVNLYMRVKVLEYQLDLSHLFKRMNWIIQLKEIYTVHKPQKIYYYHKQIL